MKNLNILFLVGLCLVLALGAANASIVIDETFDDGTPFTDLAWAYGVDSPTSAGVKGTSIFRNANIGYPTTATLAYNPSTNSQIAANATSANREGAIKNLGTGTGKVWQLNAGQKIFWGQSGNVAYPSGLGIIANYGDNCQVAQVGLGYDTSLIPNSSTGNLIGSVSYLFGNTAYTTATFSLAYELKVKDAVSAELREIRTTPTGVTSRTLGSVLPNKFAMLTTVWSFNANGLWGTIPKTGWGMTIYPPSNPAFPARSFGWATNPSEGSADGRLYPKGKGWANGSQLTSVTAGKVNTAVYSFLDTKPASYGTTTSKPYVVDSPWLIPGTYDATNALVQGEFAKVRTWKIQAGSDTSTTLYVDDLYFEATIRDNTMNTPEKRAADYRLHEFDQKLMYNPNSTTAKANQQYVGPTGLPVELSIFELR